MMPMAACVLRSRSVHFGDRILQYVDVMPICRKIRRTKIFADLPSTRPRTQRVNVCARRAKRIASSISVMFDRRTVTWDSRVATARARPRTPQDQTHVTFTSVDQGCQRPAVSSRRHAAWRCEEKREKHLARAAAPCMPCKCPYRSGTALSRCAGGKPTPGGPWMLSVSLGAPCEGRVYARRCAGLPGESCVWHLARGLSRARGERRARNGARGGA